MEDAYSDALTVFETCIPSSVKASESSAVGNSIFLHDPKGKVSAAYKSLVMEVLENE